MLSVNYKHFTQRVCERYHFGILRVRHKCANTDKKNRLFIYGFCFYRHIACEGTVGYQNSRRFQHEATAIIVLTICYTKDMTTTHEHCSYSNSKIHIDLL
jgi:hypothetical protein